MWKFKRVIKERLKIFLIIIVTLLLLLIGLRFFREWYIQKDMTAEEKVLYVEQKMEAKNGYRYFTSHQLTEEELLLVDLYQHICDEDTVYICKSLGVPDVFTDESYDSWMEKTGLNRLLSIDYDNLAILSRQEEREVEIDRKNVEIITENAYYIFDATNKENRVRFTYEKLGNRSLFIPDNAIKENYILLSPTRNLYPASELTPESNPQNCLEPYVVTLIDAPYVTQERWSSNWYQFEFPTFLNVDEPSFLMHTTIGNFKTKFLISDDRLASNTVIMDPTEEQINEFVKAANNTLSEIFRLIQNNATEKELLKYLVNEDIAYNIVGPQTEEEAADRRYTTYYSIIDSINSVADIKVKMNQNAEGTLPIVYNCRLVEDDGIVLKADVSLNTTDGECRRTTFLFFRFFKNGWKLCDMDESHNNSLFKDISPYNPQW